MLLCDYTNDGNDYIFGWCDYPNGDKCEPCLLRQAEGFFELILPDSGQRHMEESPSFDSHTIPWRSACAGCSFEGSLLRD